MTGKLACTTRETHHTYFDLEHNGILLGSTYVSHGAGKDLDDFFIRMMAKQLGVSKATFVGAVECIRSRDEVVAEIESRA